MSSTSLRTIYLHMLAATAVCGCVVIAAAMIITSLQPAPMYPSLEWTRAMSECMKNLSGTAAFPHPFSGVPPAYSSDRHVLNGIVIVLAVVVMATAMSLLSRRLGAKLGVAVSPHQGNAGSR